jgi:hypothetical protein
VTKLIAAMVLVGTLSMASGAMAYGDGRHHPNRHRDRKTYVYLEHRGEWPEFGVWLTFPRPQMGRRHWEWERERWGGHHHNRHWPPRRHHGF